MDDYKALLSDLIKKQMVILGPGVALWEARKVTALTLENNGKVISISGNPQTALILMVDQFTSLCPHITAKVFSSLLEKYPAIKKIKE